LYETQITVRLVFEYSHVGCVQSGPDLPMSYIGLSLGLMIQCVLQQTVLRIESSAVTVYDQLHN